MPVKLSIVALSAAVVVGALATGSRDVLVQPWLEAAGGPQASSSSDRSPYPDAEQVVAELDGMAHDIRSMRPRNQRFDRAGAREVVDPFELSQADGTDGEITEPAVAGDAGTAEQVAPVDVDETALRYFAAQGDAKRLAAEIARLRALYPQWTPPVDPLAVPQHADSQLEAMWQLYSQGRYPEVRKAIAGRQVSDPDWQAPADLLERLELAEERSRLVNASNLKQHQTVIDVGAANPALLNCSDVDVLWRVAEAFHGTDRPQRAVDAYSYILTNCSDPAERIATMQKAVSILGYDRFQPLLALERDTVEGREFDGIRDDLARRFVGEASEKPALTIAPEHLQRIKDLALGEDGQNSDNILLGWYHLRRGNAAEAEIWFQRARKREDSAEAARGLGLALLEQKRPLETEDVLYRWRDTSEETATVYLSAVAGVLSPDPAPVIDEKVLVRMAQAVIGNRHAPAAQLFGWYARSFDQPETAARWFETALAWSPNDEPSAYGLALTRSELKDQIGFDEIQERWAAQSVRIAELANAPAKMSRAVTATEASQPSPARQPGGAARNVPKAPAQTSARAFDNPTGRASCSNRIEPSRLSPSVALARGWCLMDLNRPVEAAETFEVAFASHDRQIREDAAYGQSLAYLRLGLTSRAAVAATKAPMTSQRAYQLQASILADRAVQAFNSDRYREALLYLDQRTEVEQETVDLMVLRGYSYMNLNRPRDALRIFEAAAATGNRDASRGLADARAQIGR